ncbi:MAG TPA: hypothetical protein VN721_07205 [Flavipsychrobacter sp.]|nr:hypothetical protein [Flavipsychrobacter sp.]
MAQTSMLLEGFEKHEIKDINNKKIILKNLTVPESCKASDFIIHITSSNGDRVPFLHYFKPSLDPNNSNVLIIDREISVSHSMQLFIQVKPKNKNLGSQIEATLNYEIV